VLAYEPVTRGDGAAGGPATTAGEDGQREEDGEREGAGQ